MQQVLGQEEPQKDHGNSASYSVLADGRILIMFSCSAGKAGEIYNIYIYIHRSIL